MIEVYLALFPSYEFFHVPTYVSLHFAHLTYMSIYTDGLNGLLSIFLSPFPLPLLSLFPPPSSRSSYPPSVNAPPKPTTETSEIPSTTEVTTSSTSSSTSTGWIVMIVFVAVAILIILMVLGYICWNAPRRFAHVYLFTVPSSSYEKCYCYKTANSGGRNKSPVNGMTEGCC